jgi:hypothetical protein
MKKPAKLTKLRSLRPARLLGAWITLHAASSAGTTPTDAVAREFSVFAGSLAGVPATDAISREFSLFAGELGPVAILNASSREFSLMAGGHPIVNPQDALSREFSILIQTVPRILIDPQALHYREGSPPLRLGAGALIEESDSTNLAGGELRVDWWSGASPGDLLTLETTDHGSISLGPDGEILFEGQAFGTASGGSSGQPLVINFLPTTTTLAVRDLIRTIAFSNTIRFPQAGLRRIALTLTDFQAIEGPTTTLEVMVEAVNQDPIAHADHLGAASNTPLLFPTARLLENDSDPDADSPLLLAFPQEMTRQGGSIRREGDTAHYSPPADFTGVDRFPYTLSDPFGGMASAFVDIHVRAPDDAAVTVRSMERTEAGFAMSLIGLPDQTYLVFASGDLVAWQTMPPLVSDETGRLHVFDVPPTGKDARFYRFALPPP